MNTNRFAIAALLLALACAASAQTDAAGAPEATHATSERQRIARERHEAESEFAAAQKACWQKFAVNDCLRRAQFAKRERLDALRQQEWALDDQQRTQRAQERLRQIEEKGKER